MSDHIKVSYELLSSSWNIDSRLRTLANYPLLAFDTETKGLYTKEQRKSAQQCLNTMVLPRKLRKTTSVVANNSGLSFPTITSTTHFIFSHEKDSSYIFVTDTYQKEMQVWNWLCKFKGVLIIHNALFDLKTMYVRTGHLPIHYEDTQHMLKTLINNADSWKAKVGLKDVMGSYYKPSWALYDKYEPDDLKDKDFLEYCAIDGAATYHLYQNIMEHSREQR